MSRHNLSLELEAPEQANEVMTQIMAELRETKARAEQPAVDLVVADNLEEEQRDRAEPLFRAAARSVLGRA